MQSSALNRRRNLTRTFGLFTLILLPAFGESCVGHRTGAGPTTALVLVYNIHAGKDAKGEDNLERLGGLIRNSGADIVLLQEVDRMTTRSGGIDQPASLAVLTGLNVVFGKSLDFQSGEYGLAVLSRWPIVADSMIPLPVDPPQERAGGSREPRGALRAVVTTPAGPVAVINTHIDASRDGKWRRQEIVTVIAIATAARRKAAVLLGGDLNSTPESAVQVAVRGAGFIDAWQRCGQGDGLTYPADSAIKRIDYLYLDPRMRCDQATVLQSDASDHRPVLVRVVLAPP